MWRSAQLALLAQLLAAAANGGGGGGGGGASAGGALDLAITVNISLPVAVALPWLASHGWEVWQALDALGTISDPRAHAIASALAPGVVRVGGITADWLFYTALGADERASPLPSLPPPAPALGGFWPTQPRNVTLAALRELIRWHDAAGLSLLFDLSELTGRNCQLSKPGCPSCTDWCGSPPAYPSWDPSNARALLAALRAGGDVGGASALFGFELGNELAWHVAPAENVADVRALARIIKDVWAGAPAEDVPSFFAPSTDHCYDDNLATYQIMANVSGYVTGFTYHAYPAGDGSQLLGQLTNATWLREGILGGSNSAGCISAWSNLTRAAGMQLWVTEASSSWNWPGSTDPPWPAGTPGQNTVLHNFFTLAELGQYARTGVGIVGRWALALGGGFGTIAFDGSRFDVAADFWLMVAHKRLLAGGVLDVAGADIEGSPALVYASCAAAAPANAPFPWDIAAMPRPTTAARHPPRDAATAAAAAAAATAGGNGSVVLLVVNPSSSPITLSLLAAALGGGSGGTSQDGAMGAPIATTPRLTWIFSAPGGNLSALAPVLNGAETPLRVNEDGSLPPMVGAFTPAGGDAGVALPPRSQAFVVLLGARAPACGAVR
jgi:hypothetical protein